MDNLAYIQGFKKVAEDFGIDPEVLIKFAGKESALMPVKKIIGTIKGLFSKKPKGQLNVDRVLKMFNGKSPDAIGDSVMKAINASQNAAQRGRLNPQTIANMYALTSLGSAQSVYNLGPKTPGALKALQERIAAVKKYVASGGEKYLPFA